MVNKFLVDIFEVYVLNPYKSLFAIEFKFKFVDDGPQNGKRQTFSKIYNENEVAYVKMFRKLCQK